MTIRVLNKEINASGDENANKRKHLQTPEIINIIHKVLCGIDSLQRICYVAKNPNIILKVMSVKCISIIKKFLNKSYQE